MLDQLTVRKQYKLRRIVETWQADTGWRFKQLSGLNNVEAAETKGLTVEGKSHGIIISFWGFL